MYFEDYLPLPVYHATDPDEDGSTDTWTFDDTADATIPAPGVVKLGPDDTFYAYMASGISGATGVLTANLLNTGPTMDPVLTANATNNRLTIAYATFDDTRNLSTTVDLLFTVTVSDDPFADRLYLTNQAQAYEGSTNGSPSTAASIVQVILTEPILQTKKGVVWTDNTSANVTYSPTPPSAVSFVGFTADATPRWSGIIGSDDLATNPIDSNISGIDAGDIVTFAITVQNVGSSGNGAFDITIQDILPTGFEIPAGGLHLQAFRGSGTQINYTNLGGGTASSDDDLFNNGIELTDPGASEGACQMASLADGNDVVIITYDLKVSDTVVPGTMVNTSTVTKYAGADGGPNHVPTPSPLEDDAEATLGTSMIKLGATEIINANNSIFQSVIGELVVYQLNVTLPEG
ncbi:hypothetical protein EG834_14595, partial [bacterium]|nr:hypothetical protein [bacterium]